MINEKGYHDCCECSHLEIEIRTVRSQFESGLIDDADHDHQVKVLILRDMLDKYRNEFGDAINKLTEDLEKSIDLGEQQLNFRQRCFKEFESLMKGVNNPKPTDD
tara:strand:- start:365 stop:679 length:315 start_codon:yes stop_codon:yes gene_type:complete